MVDNFGNPIFILGNKNNMAPESYQNLAGGKLKDSIQNDITNKIDKRIKNYIQGFNPILDPTTFLQSHIRDVVRYNFMPAELSSYF